MEEGRIRQKLIVQLNQRAKGTGADLQIVVDWDNIIHRRILSSQIFTALVTDFLINDKK